MARGPCAVEPMVLTIFGKMALLIAYAVLSLTSAAFAQTPPRASGQLAQCKTAQGTLGPGGRHGLRFAVNRRDFRVRHTNGDDYEKFVITPKGRSEFLVIYVGGLTGDPTPDPGLLKNSVDVTRKDFTSPSGQLHGSDIRGHLRGGEYWRRFALNHEGQAQYKVATREEALLLDKVIDSVCYIP